MSHRVAIEMDGDYITSRWYVNSMEPIRRMVRDGGLQMFDMFDAYQAAYGIKLVVDGGGWIINAEFPSEEEAIEFVLRWA